MDKGYYQEYYVQERNHWWFLARLKILEAMIAKISENKPFKILNIGIATGATSEMLQKYGEVTSVEYDQDCVDFVNEVVKIPVMHGSILELPFKDSSFDIVCAFDVIEHIEDDQKGVDEMMRVCKQDAHIFVTVPAYMSLWSDHDIINHHFRRYTIAQLKSLFKKSGKIIFSSYFNSIFFIPIFFARKLANLLKSKNEPPKSDFKKFNPGLLNNLMYRIFLMERSLLKATVKFPFGVSIFMHWKK